MKAGKMKVKAEFLFAQKDNGQKQGYPLRESSRNGSSRSSHMKTGNEHNIQYDIEHAGCRNKIQGTLGISQTSKNSTDSIIPKAENNSHATYINIAAGILIGFLRCLDKR